MLTDIAEALSTIKKDGVDKLISSAWGRLKHVHSSVVFQRHNSVVRVRGHVRVRLVTR